MKKAEELQGFHEGSRALLRYMQGHPGHLRVSGPLCFFPIIKNMKPQLTLTLLAILYDFALIKE